MLLELNEINAVQYTSLFSPDNFFQAAMDKKQQVNIQNNLQN